MKKNWNIFLVITFFVVMSIVFFMGSYYKESRAESFERNQYLKTANAISNKFQTLIEEKKNATLTIGLSLAKNKSFEGMLENPEAFQKILADFSQELRSETDFKNVWIQLVDNQGKVISRSWTQKVGDRIYDDTQLLTLDKTKTFINVDEYDLSFKARVPIFDENKAFLGVLETITHFNSIAKKILSEGLKPIVLVDKRYKSRLKYPFTQHFLQDYYVANKDVDVDLLEYLKKVDLEKELDYKSNYLIKEGKYLSVYYTIFDEKKRAMAYVLMYKDLKYIDREQLTHANFVVNMSMIFILVFMIFLFLLLADKTSSQNDHSSSKIKYFLVFLSVFVTVFFVFTLLLQLYKQNKQEEYLNSYNLNIEKDYEIIKEKYKAVAETMFETSLKDKLVIRLLKDAYGEAKDDARQKLYILLQERYEFYKRFDLRQLHFHLKNNESFLRFHRPQKYGDNLTGIRATVDWVNTNHRKISGFEEGRIYNGFRHVFPLSYENSAGVKEHLGSVETSFSAHSIAHEFSLVHGAKAAFIMHKDVVDTKVFKSEVSNYEQSEFDDFYYESAIKKQFEYHFRHIEVAKIDEQIRVLANQKILDGEVFTIPSHRNNSLLTFIPLNNPVSGKAVASIVLELNDNILKQQEDFFFLLQSFGGIVIFLLTLFIYREYMQKKLFYEWSVKTQHILDAQSSIVIITNGRNIFDVNKKFLDFFGYKNLEAFREDYDCICERFIEDDNYFHLGKVPEGSIWIEHLDEILHKDRVVLIEDKNSIEHSFSITYSHYKNEHSIVTFSDISGTMQEQFMLEKKVVQDLLTGAYNRDFFEKNIDKIISITQDKGLFSAIMFLDIDHFKQVNDVYGHNIGDYVLKELCNKVFKSIRADDYLIRWGGEEFLVLLATKSIDEAKNIAEHLRLMIEKHQFETVGSVTCSIGVTLHVLDEDIAQTIRRADEAMYLSKKNGRNQVTLG